MPPNFKCADVICDFCGYLAQVKSSKVPDVNVLPKRVLGAAWGPQHDRMQAGIYIPLYLVLTTAHLGPYAIFYLPADLQRPEMFEPRSPLGPQARRAGWTGFVYNLELVRDAFVRMR